MRRNKKSEINPTITNMKKKILPKNYDNEITSLGIKYNNELTTFEKKKNFLQGETIEELGDYNFEEKDDEDEQYDETEGSTSWE